MKLYLGCDHGGYEYKEALKKHLAESGHEVVDCGAEFLNKEDDYPDFVAPVARKVSQSGGKERGVLLGRSGQGEAMLANSFMNVRAAVYYGHDLDVAIQSRLHNDSNILSLGAQFMDFDEARRAVDAWLNAPFSDDPRYQRRIEKAEKLK